MNRNSHYSKIAFYVPFLFSLYLVLRLYAINLSDTNLLEVILVFAFDSVLCLLVYVPFRLILKDVVKASLITMILIFLNSTFGLTTFVWNKILTSGVRDVSNLYLLSCMGITFLIAVVAVYFIVKKEISFTLLKAITTFVIVLLCFSVWDLTTGLFSFRKIKHQSFNIDDVLLEDNLHFNSQPENLPDVYFIIFDAYTGQNELKEYFGFDNSQFLNELGDRGFFIAENSRSNYTKTPWSMYSILNMDYFPEQIELSTDPNSNQLRAFLKNTKVFELFHKLGYKTNCISLGFDLGVRDNVDNFVDSPFSTEFIEESISSTYFGYITFRAFFKFQRGADVLVTFDLLNSLSEKRANFRDFTYAHFLCPHSPFIFKADGTKYKNAEINLLGKSNEKYLGQIQYLNKRILELVDRLQSVNPKPVIIIQSDHGEYPEEIDPEQMKDQASRFDSRTSTLNVTYYPDGDYSLLYSEITSVNTFRAFIKKYIDSSFELKKDVSYNLAPR